MNTIDPIAACQIAKLKENNDALLAMLERVCDSLEDRLDRDDNSAALTDARALIATIKEE
jgi:hypothetical protein